MFSWVDIHLKISYFSRFLLFFAIFGKIRTIFDSPKPYLNIT